MLVFTLGLACFAQACFSQERITGKDFLDSCKALGGLVEPVGGVENSVLTGRICAAYIQGYLDGSGSGVQVDEESSAFHQRALETRAKGPLIRQKKMLKNKYCLPPNTTVEDIARMINEAGVKASGVDDAHDVLTRVFLSHYSCSQ